MRTMLLKTVVFCVGVIAGGAALAQSASSPAGDRSGHSSETRGSSDRWDYSGYVYGPKGVYRPDTQLSSSAAMRSTSNGTTGQDQSRNGGGCNLETELNVMGERCVPIGPD